MKKQQTCFHCEQKILEEAQVKSGCVYFHQRCFDYCEKAYAELKEEWRKEDDKCLKD